MDLPQRCPQRLANRGQSYPGVGRCGSQKFSRRKRLSAQTAHGLLEQFPVWVGAELSGEEVNGAGSG